MSFLVKTISAKVSDAPSFSLRDVSFSLKQGTILAVLGQSGAGKSSLLNALAGFLPIQHGAILLKNKTVSCASFCLPPLERNIGMIFQAHNLLPHLSLLENLTLGMKQDEVRTRKQEIRTLLQELDLVNLKDHLPHHMSGGQQQRVALGRALLHEKDLLLFDEPFSGLDHNRMVQLSETIKKSVIKYGKMAVLVTHHVEEAFLIADKVGYMEAGSMRILGTPQELYHAPPTLPLAQALGPSSVLSGVRVRSNSVKTALGIAKTVQKIPSSLRNVQMLTRPDDYELTDGSEFIVQEVVFMGMMQEVIASQNNLAVRILVPHHTTLSPGSHIGLSLRKDHPYCAYDMKGTLLV